MVTPYWSMKVFYLESFPLYGINRMPTKEAHVCKEIARFFPHRMKHSRAKPLAHLQAIQPSAVWWCCTSCTTVLQEATVQCRRVTTRMRMCNCTQLHNTRTQHQLAWRTWPCTRIRAWLAVLWTRKPRSFGDSLLCPVISQSSYKTYR